MSGHGDTIGDRFHRKLEEERLAEAFAGGEASAPASIGLIEVVATRMPAVPAQLVSALARSIGAGLPPGARVIATQGGRFTIALPGRPLLEALLAIDRVRDALERDRWTSGGTAVDLHFSAGVASRRGPHEPVLETLAAAERSLAQARHLPVRRHDVAMSEESPEVSPDGTGARRRGRRSKRGPEPSADA